MNNVLGKPARHSQRTEELARSLQPKEIYEWLVTVGYFPEAYVLPPCIFVEKHPPYNKRYFPIKKQYKATISQLCELHFPKSELTDRTFSIIDPQIHNDIALELAQNWDTLLDILFNPNKHIYSYSFPIPIDASRPGHLGKLRSGRMIYEYLEMAENDLVEEAYRYKYIIQTDIKNFYPSVYTHSIAWAFHTKTTIRAASNRYDGNLLGNRLDTLFQNANDGCTNGLPIGSVVSDLISEAILSAIDLEISATVKKYNILAVRFKDDYRFLCKSENDCRRIIKRLQNELKEFNLLLNEDKTRIKELPEGIFREWVSKYHQISPRKSKKLSFKQFKEFYLGVISIDKEHPGTGIIDRFIVDLADKEYKPLISTEPKCLTKSISLLLLLAERRIKTFPKILGLIESMMIQSNRQDTRDLVEQYLKLLLKDLKINSEENRYLISWILYFLKSNNFSAPRMGKFNHPILDSIKSNKNLIFNSCTDFKLYRDISKTKKESSLSYHLDIFKP
jgi:hypothetical protein